MQVVTPTTPHLDVSAVPAEMWETITRHLYPSEAGRLFCSCRAFGEHLKCLNRRRRTETVLINTTAGEYLPTTLAHEALCRKYLGDSGRWRMDDDIASLPPHQALRCGLCEIYNRVS